METALVLLPIGREAGGAWARTAELSALTGRDEAAIAEDVAGPPSARARRLLERCVRRVCGLAASEPGAIGGLPIGDRDALLLHLRRAAIGERLSAVVVCPLAECGEKLDLDLSVGELLAPPAPDLAPRTWHDLEIQDGAVSWRLRFRLPTVDDIDAAASRALDPGAALGALLGACVAEAVRSDGVPMSALDAWPPAVVAALSGRMQALDRQAEVLIHMECPACGKPFDSQLDVADYVTRELAARAASVFHQVHTLALRYHWSEREILDLPAARRQLYLRMLAEADGEEALS